MFALVLPGCAKLFVGDDPAARRSLAAEWSAEAFAELEAGNLEDAKGLFIDAVELSPEYAEARNALGVMLLAEGKAEQAEIQFQWAINADDERAEYHYHLALAYIAQNSVGFATPALNRALELNPDFLPAKRTLLDAYLILGRWDRAERLVTELKPKLGEEHPTLIYAEGLVAFAQEDFDTAQNRFGRAFKAMPDNAAPAAAVGLLYEVNGFFDKAESAYKLALKREENHPYLHLMVADLYQKTGRYLLAEAHLKRTLIRPEMRRELPEDEVGRVYFQIAQTGFQMGKYRTSELYRRRSLRSLPSLKDSEIGIDSAAHFAMGLVELERENVDAALREFKVAIRGNKDFTLAWVRLADTLITKAGLSPIDEREEHLDKALKSTARAKELAPRYAMGYYLEGKALMAMADLQEGAFRNGTLREALFSFQQASHAERAPNDINVYQASILSDLASHAEAASTLDETQGALKERFEIAYLKATELIKAGEFKQARAALTRAHALDPDHPDLGPAMSYVLFELGDVSGAKAALEWEPGTVPLPGLVARGSAAAGSASGSGSGSASGRATATQ